MTKIESKAARKLYRPHLTYDYCAFFMRQKVNTVAGATRYFAQKRGKKVWSL